MRYKLSACYIAESRAHGKERITVEIMRAALVIQRDSGFLDEIVL